MVDCPWLAAVHPSSDSQTLSLLVTLTNNHCYSWHCYLDWLPAIHPMSVWTVSLSDFHGYSWHHFYYYSFLPYLFTIAIVLYYHINSLLLSYCIIILIHLFYFRSKLFCFVLWTHCLYPESWPIITVYGWPCRRYLPATHPATLIIELLFTAEIVGGVSPPPIQWDWLVNCIKCLLQWSYPLMPA